MAYTEGLVQQFNGSLASRTYENTALTPMVTFNDEQLIDHIAQRNSDALGLFYDRYGRLVFTVALRITGDRETAEEVVQDVFQGVWQSAKDFQVRSGTSAAWLLGITRHRAIDATRSRRFHARKHEDTLTTEFPSAQEWCPEHQSDMRVLRDTVRDALANLPPAQRQAIELAYYGDMTNAEIASSLGQPLGTIKTRMRLGLQKLRVLFLQTGLLQEP